MQELKTDGIILNALNFRDYDQILTVFSNDQGIVKLIVKRAHSTKNNKSALTAPLTRAEFVYIKGRSEIFTCKEISPINQHLDLRTNWEVLSAAGDMAKAILETQMQHKPANTLFDLFDCYLSKIPSCTDPKALAASFRLKILRHDGLFHPTPECSICQTTLSEQHIFGGQSYCNEHAPDGSLTLTPKEMEILLLLTFSRSMSILAMTTLSIDLQAKIEHLFKSAID